MNTVTMNNSECGNSLTGDYPNKFILGIIEGMLSMYDVCMQYVCILCMHVVYIANHVWAMVSPTHHVYTCLYTNIVFLWSRYNIVLCVWANIISEVDKAACK